LRSSLVRPQNKSPAANAPCGAPAAGLLLGSTCYGLRVRRGGGGVTCAGLLLLPLARGLAFGGALAETEGSGHVGHVLDEAGVTRLFGQALGQLVPRQGGRARLIAGRGDAVAEEVTHRLELVGHCFECRGVGHPFADQIRARASLLQRRVVLDGHGHDLHERRRQRSHRSQPAARVRGLRQGEVREGRTHGAQLFDVLLCDRAGVPLFERLGCPDVRWFCQYSWKRPFHGAPPDAPRDLDVAFAGNLNPAVQRERAPWLARLTDLALLGARVEIRQGLQGRHYGALLARARIGWNRSIRGEMNLRAFEVPACGALLLMEAGNLEVRDFFVPGEECVLHGDDDFEQVVTELLRDEPRRRRIAAAGHARVQQHALGNRMPALVELLARRGSGRARLGDAAAALGRAEAMTTTWADGDALAAAAMAAARLQPDDARALNAMAFATLRWRGAAGADAALQLLQRAAAADPAFVPPVVSIAELFGAANRPDLHERTLAQAAERAARARDWRALAGPLLPFGFSARAVDWSRAVQDCARSGSTAAAVRQLAALTPVAAAS